MPAGYDESEELYCQLRAAGKRRHIAYAEAGFAPDSGNATRMDKKPKIQKRIAEILEAAAAKTEVTVEMIMRRWWDIVEADANELIQYRRTACRYCYGVGHAFRWIDAEEFAQALGAAKKAKATMLPRDDGGYGFNHTVDPNPECPRCNGEGKGGSFCLDTRRLTGRAKLLYAGVKQGRDGLEVKMHDQMKALENLARARGIFKDRVEHSGVDGAPIDINVNGGVSGLLTAAREAMANAPGAT